MRKPIQIIAFLAAAVSAAQLSPAAPEIKLVTVDVVRAYRGFWETKKAEEKFQAETQGAEEELGGLAQQLKGLEEQVIAKREEMENPVFSEDARAKARAEFEQLVAQYNENREKVAAYAENRQTQFRNRQQSQQAVLLTKVRESIAKVRQEKGATLVLDTSSQNPVVFADPAFDITDSVITELNKTKPAEFNMDKPAPVVIPPPAATTP
jgi:outer membrane protein